MESGDRLNNFSLTNQFAASHILYSDHCGRPVLILLVAASALDRTLVTEAQQLAKDYPFIDVIVITLAAPESISTLSPEHSKSLPILTTNEQWMQQNFSAIPEQEILVFLSDHNLRVLETASTANVASIKSLLSLHPELDRTGADLEPANLRGSAAPVLIIPRVLTSEECSSLIKHYQSTESEESGVIRNIDGKPTWTPDYNRKKRRDVRVTDPEIAKMLQNALARRVLPEINQAFNYQVQQYEQFKLIQYSAESGGYFRPHRDNTSPDSQHRKFAMTLNLNTHEYDGGQLHFPEYGPERYAPPAGGAAVFSCSLAHEATDVTQGTRYAVLSFFW